MKTFSRTAGVALLAILALQGVLPTHRCREAHRSKSSAAPSMASGMSSTSLGPDPGARHVGVLVTAQRIPKGLTVALAPAQERCVRDGGEPSFAELQAASQAQLPQRILCQRGAVPLWVLDIRYGNVTTKQVFDETLRKTFTFLGMTIRTQLLSADQYAADCKRNKRKRRRARRPPPRSANARPLSNETVSSASRTKRPRPGASRCSGQPGGSFPGQSERSATGSSGPSRLAVVAHSSGWWCGSKGRHGLRPVRQPDDLWPTDQVPAKG
jgi:hypothetical protein